jgi:O-antigen/teichoic acid export membrane protein
MNRSFRLITERILRWTNAVLGLNVRMFAKDAAIVTTGHGVSVLRGIVTGYLVARLFPREAYGSYQFILSIMGMIGIIAIPSLAQSLGRAVARGKDGAILPVLRRQLQICLVGSALLLGSIPFLQYFDRGNLWPLFVMAAVLFPVSQVALTVFHGIVVGKRRFDISLKSNIAWSIAMVIVTLGIIFLHPSASLLFVAVTALPAISYLFLVRGLVPRKGDEAEAAAVMTYGIQLTLAQLPILLSWYVDKLIITAYLGLNQLAIFSVAILIPEQVKTWAKELLPVSFAVQARGDDTFARRKRLIRAVGSSTAVFLLGIAAYVVLAPWIFPLLFPNYPEAVILSQVAALTLITQPSALLSQYIEAQAMLPAIRRTQWISAIIFLLSLVILIPTLGLLGAVLARGTLRLSYALCSLWFLLTMGPLDEPAKAASSLVRPRKRD